MKYMPKQFWNEEKTNLSLQVLNRIAKEADFVLIGGWAIYMHIGIQKSEDIDVAIGYGSLNFFKKYGLSDYGGINVKYTRIDDIIVDLFIEDYADKELPVPISVILKEFVLRNKIKVVNAELLLLLKTWGYFRANETKIRKDIIDVMTLLFYGDVDIKKVHAYVEKYKLERRRTSDVMLEYIDKGRTIYKYICDTVEEYDRLAKKRKAEIRKTFGY